MLLDRCLSCWQQSKRVGSALTSARTGLDTMLVERFGCFVGNITQAMVEPIGWYRQESTFESNEGISREFETRVIVLLILVAF